MNELFPCIRIKYFMDPDRDHRCAHMLCSATSACYSSFHCWANCSAFYAVLTFPQEVPSQFVPTTPVLLLIPRILLTGVQLA